MLAIWFGTESEALWQAWGSCRAVAPCGPRMWSLVLRGRRRPTARDRCLVAVSLVTRRWTMLAGNVGVAELVDDVSDAVMRALGIVLVVMLLTTALPPILRRLARTTPPADAFGRSLTVEGARGRDHAVAGRLERSGDARSEAAARRAALAGSPNDAWLTRAHRRARRGDARRRPRPARRGLRRRVTDDDWEHGLGGIHALAYEDDELVGHASVVQRRLLTTAARCARGTSRASA